MDEVMEVIAFIFLCLCVFFNGLSIQSLEKKVEKLEKERVEAKDLTDLFQFFNKETVDDTRRNSED